MDKTISTHPESQESAAIDRNEYLTLIYDHIPLYTTRLVREQDIPLRTRGKLWSPSDVVTFLTTYFRDKDREELVALYLDAAISVIALSRISVGGLQATILEPRQVFKVALLANAASVILAHHHPSGNCEPSRADIRITTQMTEAGKIMGILVRDHIIIGDDSYVSMAERGLVR